MIAGVDKGLPQRLLAFYGDDFTGSTDAMESLALAGLRTVLFLAPPTAAQIDQFEGLRCFGVAGISRSLTPAEMDAELRPVLAQLRRFATPLVHYKICSTFDSSPQVGSIGKVLDLGADIFAPGPIPLLVAAPPLRRYTVFGNHFATVDGVTHRLDRHPTMAHHPVTPMQEADLRRHLAEQTDSRIEIMDVLALDGPAAQVRQRFASCLEGEPDAVLFDGLDEEHMRLVGGLIWELTGAQEQVFVVGSSGVGYALTGYWKQAGLLAGEDPQIEEPGPAERLLVVAGSCSPETRLQIRAAQERGFQAIRAPGEELVDPATQDQARQSLILEASELLGQGEDVIVYTAKGPDDPSIQRTRERLLAVGGAEAQLGQRLGSQLGRLTRQLVEACDVRRLVVAGGDTAGYVTRQLGIYALEMVMPLAPGSPLCRAYAGDARFDGFHLALKGGQVGGPGYLLSVKAGQRPSAASS